MKTTLRILFFTFLISLASSSFAQPVTGNAMPPVGTAFEMRSISSNLNLASAGANQTWDYSQLTSSALFTLTWTDLATVPQAVKDTFPNADHATEINIGGGQYIYRMYQSTATDLIDWGEKGSGNSWQVFHPAHEVSHYGMGLGNNYTDNGYNYGIFYAGYGTLITPFGTNNNVILTKEFFVGNTDTLYNFISYQPHFQKLMSYATSANGIVSKFFYKPLAPNSVKEATSENRLVIFPNPGSEKLNLIIPFNNTAIQLFDMTGKLVRELAATKGAVSLATADLPNGLYIVTVKGDGTSISKKWSKQ